MSDAMDPVEIDETDLFTARLRRERASRALLPLFFVSGATALVYQTIWARQLHLIFGTSTFAIATVLAAFMAGLAIGGFSMARWADKLQRPLLAYGVLEVVIGLYSIVFPTLLGWVEPLYLGVHRSLDLGPWAFGVVQFALVGTLLLLPTACMGATLPLLARYATDRLASAGDRVGTLYAVNTAGAVFGTFAAGFFLLPGLGLFQTTLLAAAANIALGVGAMAVDRWAKGHESVRAEQDLGDLAFDPIYGVVALTAGLAGYSALVYEVAWTRVCALMLGASVYAFSIMLLAFLVGIASGGWIGGKLADRLLARFGYVGVLWGLAATQVGVAALSYSLMWTFPELPFVYVWLWDAMGAGESASMMFWVSAIIASAVMTPPAVLMGVSFPLAVRAVVGKRRALGGPVGTIYGANTLGSLLGAAMAGFLWLPVIGIWATVVLAVGVNLLGALILLAWGTRERGHIGALPVVGAAAILGLFATAVYGVYGPRSEEALVERRLLMTAGMYKYVSQFTDHSREGIRQYTLDQWDLLYYNEGIASVVTVAKNRETGNILLANNGKVEASTTADMPTQVLVSLLPFQFVDDPDEVLVIGLASGITAGSVTTVDAIERLDIAELEPSIVDAARYFDAENHRVLDNPITRVVLNDGRNHLLRIAPASYDVVVSEPSNPWITGVSNLFTKEFFELGKSRLKPGGVWSQWVQMYGMGEHDLLALLATFSSVYPHVMLFMTIEDGDLVIVGSESPLNTSPQRVAAMMERWPRARDELELVGLDDPLELVSTWMMNRDTIVDMTEGYPLNTDDNMLIEYGAPLNLHRETGPDNVEMLMDHAQIPLDVVTDPFERMRLSTMYLSRNDWLRCMLAALAALEAVAFEHEVPRAIQAVASARAHLDEAKWSRATRSALAGMRALDGAPDRPEAFLARWTDWHFAMMRYLGDDSGTEGGGARPERD